jgi:hypothetical protein
MNREREIALYAGMLFLLTLVTSIADHIVAIGAAASVVGGSADFVGDAQRTRGGSGPTAVRSAFSPRATKRPRFQGLHSSGGRI